MSSLDPDTRRGSSRGVIVTAAGPTMRSVLHDQALPTFHRFAARWGYDVRPEDLGRDGSGADDPAQGAKFTKLAILRAALTDYPLALWLDADVLVVRFDEDVADHLHPDHFQALGLEQVPFEHRVNPNTGVWVMRSCPEAFHFLAAVEEAGPQPGPWADQGAVLAALGWRRGDEEYHWAGPGAGSPFLEHTSWLPPGWNQPHVDGRDEASCYNSPAESYATRPTVPRPHAVHFMGLTPEARASEMARLAAAALGE
ncbi:hypothetical protein Intca_3589 [Intrasporangium calvum DSM 43043]|uniref:Nucleotide-diphospho-sugar transferase domain-containing protein n=1 Tax=Intrasporangium calvum (strain ATCC 23552 / DSM 43043 / JCM 3097 / NBRC 12989 / NCIMB 10167 / NRRL B-3866 / 7 KIP) TaxID=710696 RepID=E6S6P5_INTC7|nr:hypothetical protein Intca_3589 [Intrasporangium calvum DSM 43043]